MQVRNFTSLLTTVYPLYIQVLQELAEAGAQWVQIDEPILKATCQKRISCKWNKAYAAINEAVPELKIIVQTYFEKVANY